MAAASETEVLWDFEGCKIPDGLSVTDVAMKIREALWKTGHGGVVTITGYGDLANAKTFYKAGIGSKFTGSDRIDDRLSMILADLLCHAVTREGDEEVNVMLIVGDISGHAGFLRALRYLKSNYDILLVQPDAISKQLHLAVKHAWVWSSLLGGEGPNKKPRKGKRYELRDVVPYTRADTAVFWNMDDCPIPDDVGACEVLRNISLGLREYGYADGDGTVSIYAYGKTNLIEGLESTTGAVYVPISGVEPAKHEKIFLDFAFCVIDNPHTRNLVLIAGEVKGQACFAFEVLLHVLRNKGYRKRLLVRPANAPEDQFSAAVSLSLSWDILSRRSRQ